MAKELLKALPHSSNCKRKSPCILCCVHMIQVDVSVIHYSSVFPDLEINIQQNLSCKVISHPSWSRNFLHLMEPKGSRLPLDPKLSQMDPFHILNHYFFRSYAEIFRGPCSSVDGWGNMLQAGRLRVWFPLKSMNFSIDLILPGCIMALGLTQPLTEMSTRNLPGGKQWLAHEPDNLTAICEPTV
jgi:hypothetical protein